MRSKKLHPGVILSTIILVLLLSLSVSADEGAEVYYGPTMSIDLGVSDLTLNVGDTYTFNVIYQPENPLIPWLNWFITDEDVVSIDPDTSVLTAKAAGNVRILAETFDKGAYAICDVTVNGDIAKSVSDVQIGSSLITISEEDQKKITAPVLARFMKFVNNSYLSVNSAENASERTFVLPADVTPGTENKQAERAFALGMEQAVPLLELHVVNLQGTFEQMMAFASDNPDLIEIFDLPMKFLDPISYEEDSQQKTVRLEGNVENLTRIRFAHDSGFDGTGTTIAIIDSGINTSHLEFRGRIAAQACFSTNYKDGNTVYSSVCASQRIANPARARVRENFDHGTHVAGIMAGKNGIAQNAKIVAVQAFSEVCRDKVAANTCYGNVMFSTDELSSYNYLIGLAKQGMDIAAVNMSYGGGKYSSTCDETEHNYLAAMRSYGIVPVAAAGNCGYDGYLASPACDSASFVVGALEDSPTPLIKQFSNHNTLVDMLAPGTNIWSSSLAIHGNKLYTYMSGTSMAAPMVTGGLAILKQMFPYNTAAEYESLITYISPRSVSKRVSGYAIQAETRVWIPEKTFPFSRPIMDFYYVDVLAPGLLNESQVVVDGFNNGVNIYVPYDSNTTGYTYRFVNTDTGSSVPGISAAVTDFSSEGVTVITFTGSNLVNDTIYKLDLYPYRRINGVNYRRDGVSVYVMPSKPIDVTVKPLGSGAQVYAKNPSSSSRTQFNVYEASTGKLVRTISLVGTRSAGVISGLKNGNLYYVNARTYKIFDRRNTAWGAYSDAVYFVPLPIPAGIRITWPDNTTAEITMMDDRISTGFRVFLLDNTGALRDLCQAGINGSCRISGMNKNDAYTFYIMKYKRDSGNNNLFYGPGTVLPYRSVSPGLTAPENVSVTINSGNKAVVSITKAARAEGFVALFKWGNNGGFEFGCESAGDTCTIRDVIHTDSTDPYTFFVMQYRWLKGQRVYSPGVTVFNSIGPKTPEEAMMAEESGDGSGMFEDSDLFEILGGYLTEEDVLRDEALKLIEDDAGGEMGPDAKSVMMKTITSYSEEEPDGGSALKGEAGEEFADGSAVRMDEEEEFDGESDRMDVFEDVFIAKAEQIEWAEFEDIDLDRNESFEDMIRNLKYGKNDPAGYGTEAMSVSDEVYGGGEFYRLDDYGYYPAPSFNN